MIFHPQAQTLLLKKKKEKKKKFFFFFFLALLHTTYLDIAILFNAKKSIFPFSNFRSLKDSNMN